MAPVFASAAVNGTALTLTFDEALGAASALANSAFTVKKTPYGGAQATVTLSGTPAISGKTVSLTLAAAVTAVDTNVTVSYTRPGAGSNNTLVDVRDNAVVDFTDAPVNNLLSDTTPPALDTAVVDDDALTLTYNEHLYTGSVPSPGDFSVSVAGHTAMAGRVMVSGRAVMLEQLSPAAVNGDSVTVTYTAGSAPIQDLAGNDAAGITRHTVDNVTISPPSAPGNPMAAATGYRQVTLGWAAPSNNGGAAIAGYEYRVSPDGGNNWSPDWTAVPGANPGRCALVRDTGPDQRDDVYVRGAGGESGGQTGRPRRGCGPRCSTGMRPIRAPPRGFTAQAGDAAVMLSWQLPRSDGNRPPLRYEVRYADGNAIPSDVSWQDVGNVLTHTLRGLTNGRQHTFEVRAVNTASLGGRPGAGAGDAGGRYRRTRARCVACARRRAILRWRCTGTPRRGQASRPSPITSFAMPGGPACRRARPGSGCPILRAAGAWSTRWRTVWNIRSRCGR